ncbi:hypothetical protein I546_2251 [Mycobacterium kansasii 732]|nr:hypothetical protein I546_2251 [Mycobacterium kansasii 732]
MGIYPDAIRRATWPRPCCTATPATAKPSPGSAGCVDQHAIGVITGEVEPGSHY